MIIDYSEMLSGGFYGSVFQGKVEENPYDWTSVMPDIGEFMDKIKADPALAYQGLPAAAAGAFEQSFDAAWRFIAQRALDNVVSVNRQLFGSIARTTGIVSRDLELLVDIYDKEESVALKVVNVVSGVVESELFQRGLDAIGAVPVVGWVVSLCVRVAESIVKIIDTITSEKEAEAYRQIAHNLSIPISAITFDNNTDEQVTRQALAALSPGSEYNPESLITPAYDPYDNGTVYWEADGVYDDAGDSDLALGFICSSNPTGGFGFVPGTGNMTRSLFFQSRLGSAPGSGKLGCTAGSPRDLGSLYPSAQGVVNSWWSKVLAPGPAMFSVAPDYVRDDWEDYIFSLLALGIDLMKGWSCVPSGIPFTDKFWCVKELYEGDKQFGSCKNSTDKGDKRTIPSDTGRGAHLWLVGYTYKMFFGLEDPQLAPMIGPAVYKDDLGRPYPKPEKVDLSRSVPSIALQNLRERQRASLRSTDLFYVDGRDPGTYSAFRDLELRDQWETNAQALMEAGQWRRAVYVDMPEGDLKDAVRNAALNHGIDPENLNAPCPVGEYCPPSFKLARGPSVLGDPDLPPVPRPNDVPEFTIRPIKSGGSGGGGGGGLLLGAAAVAAFALLKR